MSCRPARVSIENLVPEINRITALPVEYIESVLYSTSGGQDLNSIGASHPKDTWRKLSEEEKSLGFKAETSISANEADTFIYSVARLSPPGGIFTYHKNGAIAYSLNEIFFGGAPVYETPGGTPNDIPPHEGRPISFFTTVSPQDPFCNKETGGCYCHDLDTCNVSEPPPNLFQDCLENQSPSREAYIDAPERGFIPGDPATRAWVLGTYRGMRVGKAPYFNTKLAENSIKIFREMIKNHEKLGDEEIFNSIQLIATWEDYRAILATAAANGFANFVTHLPQPVNTPSYLYTRGTTIRFASKKRPEVPSHLCGMRQRYDKFLRRIDTFFVRSPEIIGEYLANRSYRDVTAFAEHFRIHGKYSYWIDERVRPLLASSKNQEVRAMAEKLGSKTLYKAEAVYDPQKALTAIKAFFEASENRPYLKDYGNCWTLVKVLLGLAYPYQKYRTQDFALFRRAGEFARENKLGFWGIDPTFAILYDHNKKLDLYIPEDCLTGEM